VDSLARTTGRTAASCQPTVGCWPAGNGQRRCDNSELEPRLQAATEARTGPVAANLGRLAQTRRPDVW